MTIFDSHFCRVQDLLKPGEMRHCCASVSSTDGPAPHDTWVQSAHTLWSIATWSQCKPTCAPKILPGNQAWNPRDIKSSLGKRLAVQSSCVCTSVRMERNHTLQCLTRLARAPGCGFKSCLLPQLWRGCAFQAWPPCMLERARTLAMLDCLYDT